MGVQYDGAMKAPIPVNVLYKCEDGSSQQRSGRIVIKLNGNFKITYDIVDRELYDKNAKVLDVFQVYYPSHLIVGPGVEEYIFDLQKETDNWIDAVLAGFDSDKMTEILNDKKRIDADLVSYYGMKATSFSANFHLEDETKKELSKIEADADRCVFTAINEGAENTDGEVMLASVDNPDTSSNIEGLIMVGTIIVSLIVVFTVIAPRIRIIKRRATKK